MAVNNQEENFIQLKKDNILRIGIKDAEGNDTGKHLEFDIEDLSLPLRLQECDLRHKANVNFLKMKYSIIDGQEEKQGKKLLSWKEEERIKALNEFYQREMDALDLFLGKGGCKKLLNGRNPYYSMYDDIGEVIEPILPKLQLRSEDIKNKIVGKYGKNTQDGSVLK